MNNVPLVRSYSFLPSFYNFMDVPRSPLLKRVARGESVVLSRRGRRVAQLDPLRKRTASSADDPIYRLYELAVEGESASNEQIDREVYGF